MISRISSMLHPKAQQILLHTPVLIIPSPLRIFRMTAGLMLACSASSFGVISLSISNLKSRWYQTSVSSSTDSMSLWPSSLALRILPFWIRLLLSTSALFPCAPSSWRSRLIFSFVHWSLIMGLPRSSILFVVTIFSVLDRDRSMEQTISCIYVYEVRATILPEPHAV